LNFEGGKKMKKLLLAVVALALLLLSSCQQMAGPQGDEAQEAQAIEQADQKSAQMLDLLVAARATGDSTELESFLNDEDPDGQLRALLEAHWVFRKPLQSKEVYYLPEFGTDAYLDKDVLVCKGSGGATSNLMDLILVNGYSHAGILNKDFAPPLDDPYLLPREREQQACLLTWTICRTISRRATTP
jgi:predicted small secreted protein